MKRALALLVLMALPGSAAAYTYVYTTGCPANTGAHWPARLLPTSWKLNAAGYSKLNISDVRATLTTAVGHWGEPCCSGFTARYDGTTQNTAQNSASENVLSFEEKSWDPALGNSTIAVTTPLGTSNCELIASDMLFNGVLFTFAIDGTHTDLESIATHEFGHWTGLGHTTVGGATMQPYYMGGNDLRSLEQDDIDGECSLYPVTCTQCKADGECQAGSTCVSGRCRPADCNATSACPAGSVCRNRTCLPGCRSNAECTSPEQCVSGTCRTDCPICQPCTGDDDCGGSPYVCVDTGMGPHCTMSCNMTVDCDGDSVCDNFNTSGGRIGLCLAPNAKTTDYCPASYTCKLITGCPGLWNKCPDSCLKGSDRCVDDASGAAKCTCGCAVDADCGTGARCIDDPSAGKVCYPESAIDPCMGVKCDPGFVCQKGACVDACTGVKCAADQVCQAGTCVSVCGAPCPAGQRCDPVQKMCVMISPCDGVVCSGGLVCDEATGGCVQPDPCKGITCDAGKVCNAGTCVAVDPCAGVLCGAGKKCQMGTCVADCVCPDGTACPAGGCPLPVSANPNRSSCSTAGGGEASLGLLLVLGFLARRRR